MAPYNILLLGSGGREHAIAAHIAQSPKCNQLFIAPGNAGTALTGTNLPFAATDFAAIKQCVLDHDIRMIVVGPEDPLVQGLVDRIHGDEALRDVLVFGPEAAGARLEGSKAFAKDFMMKAGIPTAAYREFSKDQLKDAIEYLRQHDLPVVIKADGLAAGKGVIIAQSADEAIRTVEEIFGGQFGAAGDKIVVEAFLDGIEFSVFVATNGDQYVILPVAKDYKKVFEGDKGPNTGGMGAVSPVSFVGDGMMSKVVGRIVQPTLSQLKKEGIPYTGFIFLGLIEVRGEPFVIEYNVRMGDPETEVVFPRIKSDMVEVMENLVTGKPVEPLEVDPDFAAGIYIVSDGYPGDYSRGKPIDTSALPSYCDIFHGGTKLSDSGAVVSNGGRVMFVYSTHNNLAQARKKALEGADAIVMENKYYRRDIGKDVDNEQ